MAEGKVDERPEAVRTAGAKAGTRENGGQAGAKPPRDEAVQHAWFSQARGHTVAARLLEGKSLQGTLVGFDRYTFTLQVATQAHPVLVAKHGVIYMARIEDAGAG